MADDKKSHFLDLKFPLGALLSFYGTLLIIYGLFTGSKLYQKSLGININLIWGGLILLVGVAMLLASLIKKRQAKR
jgi:arginine exporter protein ArgO